jgi:DNA-binding transcriptional regulator GbsR (MarR family)
MAEVKMLTAKQLAEKAGISPTSLRNLLRKEFNRVGKTKVEGNRMEYRFAPNDPIVKQIVEKAKTLADEKVTVEKPEAKEV